MRLRQWCFPGKFMNFSKEDTGGRSVETGETGGSLQPRFWLKLTFYQLTMIVKRKEPKNINYIKFLEGYWQLYFCPRNVIPLIHKTNFDRRCIFYSASFFIFYHDDNHLEKQYFIKPCLSHWGYKLWGYIPLRP